MPSDIVELNPKRHPQIAGMRYDGQRWVDDTRPDRPMLPVVPQEEPGKDMFGGSGIRKPPRKIPGKIKSRRRGPTRT